MITEPPQPPQKHTRPSGRYGYDSGCSASRTRCRTAAGRRARDRCRWSARRRSACTSRATAAGRRRPRPRRRRPTADGRPTGRCRGRWPRRSRPAATPRVQAIVASGGGPVNVLTITLSGSSVSRSIGSGGGGTTFETRWSCSGPSPMWKSAPSGPATSLAKNWPSVQPGDAPDHLADEVTLVQRVIAGRRARLPPRRLGGEHRRRLLPVEDVVDHDRLRPAPTRPTSATSGGAPRSCPCPGLRTPASTRRRARTRRAGRARRGRGR